MLYKDREEWWYFVLNNKWDTFRYLCMLRFLFNGGWWIVGNWGFVDCIVSFEDTVASRCLNNVDDDRVLSCNMW